MNFKGWVETCDQGFASTSPDDPEMNGLIHGLAHYKPVPKGKSRKSKAIDTLYGKKSEATIPEKGAGFVFTDGHHILLLQRSPDSEDGETWDLPAGGMKDDETPREAAEREAQEEIGDCQGKTFYTSSEDDGDWTFFFNKVKKPFACQLNKEHIHWKWFRFNELNSRSIKLHPKVKEKIKRYVSLIKKEFE